MHSSSLLLVLAVRAFASEALDLESRTPFLSLRHLQNSSPENSTTTTAAPANPYPQAYHLWKPEVIKHTLYEWADFFPDFVRLTNAQEAYGLPTAGGQSDCPYDDDIQGCRNYILTVQDYIQHPDGSASSNALPEVFLSGELHGNERVGPTAVMEAAHLLLLAADCEAKPRHFDTSRHSFNEKNADWASQKKAAKDCRLALKQEHGMDDLHRQWLARLVATRRIVIVPTANALGYYRNHREEGTIDPNRDFPYDVQKAKDCMQTIAGRTLNEIFRQHMFQLSLTFHGGMEVVAYEWGAPTWMGHLSPDDTAQATIGRAYSEYGGGFVQQRVKPYNYGTMNDLVYYVRGGFEDWAYAGSWDPDRVLACQPTTFNGYDAAKTKYNNSTLRVFNMLVETSDQKEPADSTLGTSQDVFNADTAGNGHVSRNIRLSLLAVDAVQPYVAMVGVNELTLTDDVVPLRPEQGRSCQTTKAVMVPGNQPVTIRWTVGGAFDIDTTDVWYAKWDSVPEEVLNCVDPPTKENLKKYFTSAPLVGPSTGRGFFHHDGATPSLEGTHREALGPVFAATVDVSSFQTHDKLVVVATALVDQKWKTQPADFEPRLPPQSHIVNARTNPDWRHELEDGKVVQGRLDWMSAPLTIVVGDYDDSVGTQAGRQVGTVEMSNRFGETTGAFYAGMTPSASSNGKGGFSLGYNLGYVLGIMVIVAFPFLCYQRFCSPGSKWEKPEDYNGVYQDDDDDDDEYGIPRGTNGPYSDKPNKELELNALPSA